MISEILSEIDALVASYARNERPSDVYFYLAKVAQCLELKELGVADRQALEERRGALQALLRTSRGWLGSTTIQG